MQLPPSLPWRSVPGETVTKKTQCKMNLITQCKSMWSQWVTFHTPLKMDIKAKVKQSNYRPGQALRVPKVWGSQISWQSTHEGGKVVSPTHWNIPGTRFC